ncbi:MAG TPA: DUF1684 domain-containing protein [Candidatus Limnocylindrales bacterium]|nr:DUF1684 domain-containing protein [Candidatus Limnocylindrales bacterium]
MTGSPTPGSPTPGATDEADELDKLELADWRRRVSDLYTEIRATSVADPRAAWDTWRAVREWLYREHPQSPVPESERAAFRARHFAYEPALRFEVAVLPGDAPAGSTDPEPSGIAGGGDAGKLPGFGGFGSLMLPVSTGGEQSFRRIGFLDVPFAAGTRRLGLYWMAGYAGGLFLPFRDATNGHETYGAGRYLLDAAKSADLGAGQAPDSLVLDFNFSYQPSCAFDPMWACPLSPPENRLDVRIEAGERLG